jgi:hypothetical protein
MSGWVAIALVVAGLVGVAVAILISDVLRGDIGGGRHTMERARRLLVVATDDRTAARADEWVAEQRREHPRLQCFVLVKPEGQELFEAVEDAIERERPDAMVMVRHEGDRSSDRTDTFTRVREQGLLPVDAIYVPDEGSAAA